MSNTASVYSDFCQAWVSRFPGSDLPAAWEEDVRANLKKHKSKVSVLREELEKEEMYVEYLDKLLGDIESHRKHIPLAETAENDKEAAMNTENRRRSSEFADSNGGGGGGGCSKKQENNDDVMLSSGDGGAARDRPGQLYLKLSEEQLMQQQHTEFVTVINVPAPKSGNKAAQNSSPVTSEQVNELSSFKKIPPRPPPKRAASRDSLNSVSSPTTPSSAHNLLLGDEDDLENPRESLLSPSSKEVRVDSEEEDFEYRGRPDGRDNPEDQQQQLRKDKRPQLQQHPKVNKIKELMANWESGGGSLDAGAARPLSHMPTSRSQAKEIAGPIRASSLKDSERGRMGSPSGKSHDSSDGENNNFGSGGRGSPGRRRRVLPSASGETRLDRLVRRPSVERSSPNRHSEALPVPPVPKPLKKPRAKPRSTVGSVTEDEPLYDTVANEEPEDEYDNHLLYGTNSTTKSGGSSSADLGFDEPKHHAHNSSSLVKSAQSGLSGSGTLSSTETNRSHSLKRGLSLPEEEEEGNYVNIQYFLHGGAGAAGQVGSSCSSGKPSASSSTNMLDTIQSDEELEKENLSSSAEVLNEESESETSSSSSEADRILMYKSILNSIVDNEAAYLECLSVMVQYMKAMKVTLTTSQPVIPKEEFDVIFYKIPELHDLHLTFHESLKKQVVDRCEGGGAIGHTFKMLASRTKIYAAFLANYRKALEALHRSSEAYPQFADLTRSIKLRSVKGQQQQGQSLSLEDLLHKPVAKIQKQALSLQDLLQYAPPADRVPLTEAMRLVQDFVGEYNSMQHASNELFPVSAESGVVVGVGGQQQHALSQQQRRHLVKNSFIVELHEGVRKLRHLFLFNDVLVCAKYKASTRKTEKFTFLLKWYIPLRNVSAEQKILLRSLFVFA
jgi:hypothetical protein